MATLGNKCENVGKSRDGKWDTIDMFETTRVHTLLGGHFSFLTTVCSTTVFLLVHLFQSVTKSINAPTNSVHKLSSLCNFSDYSNNSLLISSSNSNVVK